MFWSLCIVSLLVQNPGTTPQPTSPYAFISNKKSLNSPISKRFPPPSGFSRVPLALGSFGSWLRQLPLLPRDTSVRLHSGELKARQDVHMAVIDLDVGRRDLQQCADAVIRLRAEFLFSKGRDEKIVFEYTNGSKIPWSRWLNGERPKVHGNKVNWRPGSQRSRTHENFRRYLDNIFIYAGTVSLTRELPKVSDPLKIKPGDVFLQGGFPGHAVIVLDLVENNSGEKLFLLGQSYMPAQQFHVLKNPQHQTSAWYPVKAAGKLNTPEWTFDYSELYRFNGSP